MEIDAIEIYTPVGVYNNGPRCAHFLLHSRGRYCALRHNHRANRAAVRGIESLAVGGLVQNWSGWADRIVRRSVWG
jgi:hypothetical protein